MVQIHRVQSHIQLTTEFKGIPTNLRDRILNDIDAESQLLNEIRTALKNGESPEEIWRTYGSQSDALSEDLSSLIHNTSIPSNIRSLLATAGDDTYSVIEGVTPLQHVEKAPGFTGQSFYSSTILTFVFGVAGNPDVVVHFLLNFRKAKITLPFFNRYFCHFNGYFPTNFPNFFCLRK